MNGALRALLEGVIDYAGLFPPARLSVPEAVAEYLECIHGPDKWLVDRFVCGVGKLPELAVELAEHPEEPFVPVSVVAAQHPDHKHWKHGLEHDAQEMTKFEKAVENHAEIQAFEIRVPDHRHLAEYTQSLRSFENIDTFVELPWGPEMNDSLAMLAETDTACVKVRTGGLEATAFPTSAELAGFIQQCVQLDLTFKLTAGLHHALPGVDEATGAVRHGFLNVLTATALALSHDLSVREIEKVLEEREPRAFSFKKESLVWRDHKATMEHIENARTLLVSFGSCSVREPLQDLERLNLLEKAGR